ncbi:MAG TPA: exonuclease domain-containing protein [Candidatus Paceibacterota bacterium]|nr:exonuclease domain-containing protein [Candidatus Paceibacterota bacterium]
MKIIFFDTETTGSGDKDRLVSLAVKERGKKEPILNALYKPSVPIPVDAMAIHHITPKMVADKPSFLLAPEYEDLKQLFEADDVIGVAHNAGFDVTMLSREGIDPRNVICTYKVARALDPEGKIPRYNLQYLRYLLGLEIEAVAHDAFGDVLVLEGLFERLLEKAVDEHGSEEAALKEMLGISERPFLFTTFRFGKHEGKKIEEVAKTDRSYLEWLLNQKSQDPMNEGDWIYTLEHYLAETGA